MNKYKETCANCHHVFYTINPNLLDEQKYCLQCNIGLLSLVIMENKDKGDV